MNPTTLDVIESDFISVLHDLTPRYTTQADYGWKYHEFEEYPSERLRYFTIRWEVVGIVDGGLFGLSAEEEETECQIITDYGGIPENELMKIAWDDHLQLEDVLHKRKSPTVDGLLLVRSKGLEIIDITDGDNAQIEHKFRVHYLKATA